MPTSSDPSRPYTQQYNQQCTQKYSQQYIQQYTHQYAQQYTLASFPCPEVVVDQLPEHAHQLPVDTLAGGAACSRRPIRAGFRLHERPFALHLPVVKDAGIGR